MGNFSRSADLKSFIIFEKFSEEFQSTAVEVILGFYQKFSDWPLFEQPMTHCLLTVQYGTKETQLIYKPIRKYMANTFEWHIQCYMNVSRETSSSQMQVH